MANLAIPFSLSDILERVIPGSLLLTLSGIAFHDSILIPGALVSSPLIYAAFLACSYALGVSLNSLSDVVKIKGYRTYWSTEPSAMERAVRHAFEAHFGIPPDNNSWRLCFGTVIKQGYGANTQLFLGLEVFCRAMFVACSLASASFIGAFALAWERGSPFVSLLIWTVFLLAFSYLFRRGAKNYSQAFVGSIYEGFFNWVCDEKARAPAKLPEPKI